MDIVFPEHLRINSLRAPGQNAAIENDNTPEDNPTTDDGATLGRVLFYDTSLSKNGTVACASCHQQDKAFSDNAIMSRGFDGGKTRRHSMSLVNAGLYARGRFFWDERSATLEDQVLMPFQDEVEMGLTLSELENIVSSQPYYPELFTNAFGSEEISSDKIAKALAQFIRSIISTNSKYDIARAEAINAEVPFDGFTDSENNGKDIFFLPPQRGGGACIGCHSTEAFINPDNGTTNNGLDMETLIDLGVYEAIPDENFLGAFKVPSLKSIELSAPYMHDGRFATLGEVVEHYNSGIQNHINLGNALRDPEGEPLRLNLSDQDKIDLVNFLKTLTDYELVNDIRFSDPFVR